jgi:hypothetical protein
VYGLFPRPMKPSQNFHVSAGWVTLINKGAVQLQLDRDSSTGTHSLEKRQKTRNKRYRKKSQHAVHPHFRRLITECLRQYHRVVACGGVVSRFSSRVGRVLCPSPVPAVLGWWCSAPLLRRLFLLLASCLPCNLVFVSLG